MAAELSMSGAGTFLDALHYQSDCHLPLPSFLPPRSWGETRDDQDWEVFAASFVNFQAAVKFIRRLQGHAVICLHYPSDIRAYFAPFLPLLLRPVEPFADHQPFQTQAQTLLGQQSRSKNL